MSAFSRLDSYLHRIGYNGSREPTVNTLKELHRAHMLTVPFENLDISLGYPINISLMSSYDKIVGRRRGGFCYELNGQFGWLLEQFGFSVIYLSARVFKGEGVGPEFAHLVLLVELEDRWIADVGFGESFLEPLPFVLEKEELQAGRRFRLIELKPSSEIVMQLRQPDSDWASQYCFTITPRQLTDFKEMCHYHQTSPETMFTQKSICSMATETGRITLSNNRFITSEIDNRNEIEIETEEEYRKILKDGFGMELESEDLVGKLLKLDGN